MGRPAGELTPCKQPAANDRWELVGEYLNFLVLVLQYQPEVPRDQPPAAHSRNLLFNARYSLPSLPCLTSPHPYCCFRELLPKQATCTQILVAGGLPKIAGRTAGAGRSGWLSAMTRRGATLSGGTREHLVSVSFILMLSHPCNLPPDVEATMVMYTATSGHGLQMGTPLAVSPREM